MGKVWALIFGENTSFMEDFLQNKENVSELQLNKWNEEEKEKKREYSYIRPLSGSVGPKQTKCNCSDVIDHQDFEAYCSVIITTSTPDVPSGSSFVVKTRYCLTWAKNNATRLVINCTVDWSKSSWLKGPIEKGAMDGQSSYAKGLIGALNQKLGGGPTKDKKSKRHRKSAKVKGDHKKSAQPSEGFMNNVQNLLPGPEIFNNLSGVGLLSLFCLLGLLGVLIELIRLERTIGTISASSIKGPSQNTKLDISWSREQDKLWDWLDSRIPASHAAYANEDYRNMLNVAEINSKLDGRSPKMEARDLELKLVEQQRHLDNVREALKGRKV